MRRKAFILFLTLAMLLSYSIPALNSGSQAFAASNPYPKTQNVDGDAYYEVPCTRFAWQCVYDKLGVALPNWGNAVDWWKGAKNSGYVTGNIPLVGAIAVWKGDTYGHVAYVTAGSGSTFTVDEGGRTDKDQTNSHGVVYGYQLTNAVGKARPYDTGKTLLGFIYPKPPTITLVYDAKGGTAIASEKAKFGSVFYTPSADSTSKVGYTLVGFNGYRYYDKTYYVSGTGWIKASEIDKYQKAVYAPGSSHKMSSAWIKNSSCTKLRFDAVWKGTNHKISYDANGGKGTVPKTITVVTGKKFTIASKGNLYKKYLVVKNYKFNGWTVVRNSDNKYYATDNKWYANNKTNLKNHPARIYKPGEKYTLGAAAWLGTSMKNTNASFTFKADWKK